MIELIDIQNNNNECFRQCLVRYVNPVRKNIAKIRNVDRVFAKQLNFKNFLFTNKTAKIEKQNNLSINVFGYQNKTSCHIYTLKQTFEKRPDLLLISNTNNTRYVLIKDFNRFRTSQTKRHRKKCF